MKIPPDYQITPEIIELIAKIEANRYYLSSLEISLPIKEKLRRKSILKSSIFSARIEGNPLTMEGIASAPRSQKKIEVFNLSSAINFVEGNVHSKKRITEKFITNLHSVIMKRLSPEAGRYRVKAEAIFNQAGMVIYLAPAPEKISPLIKELINYVNSPKERFPLIKAMIAHLVFEEIHPFADGNGRAGRLLITAVLRSANYDFGLFVPFEQFVENHCEEYYHFLSIGTREPEEYLVFMLKAFYEQTEKLKKEVSVESKEDFLLPPRREEIYRIVQDHQMISFDAVRRRFLSVPERTLRYDLKKLVDQGLIVRVGITNGSYYTIKREKHVG